MEIEISNFYKTSLDRIKKVVLESLIDEDVMIILFGSAARGDAHRFSDIDIGILPKNNYNKKKLILLKEQLDNMNIPYTIDLVDISKVSVGFREKVLTEGIIWKN
jgi:predicted nucleotidyltransferase